MSAKFLFLTSESDDGSKEKIIVRTDAILMIVPCPDKKHGCHISLGIGVLSIAESFETVSAMLGELSIPPASLN